MTVNNNIFEVTDKGDNELIQGIIASVEALLSSLEQNHSAVNVLRISCPFSDKAVLTEIFHFFTVSGFCENKDGGFMLH